MEDRLRNILALIKRSERDPEGWYEVSDAVWPTVAPYLPTDLVTLEPSSDGGGKLKLTERGQAVCDYL